MPNDIHPGSFVGDTIEEFKKLPMWGKVALGGGVAVIVIVFIYKAKSAGGSAATSTTLPATTNPSTQGVASMFPGVQSGSSSVPFVPSSVNPVYDAQGGLVAFQQAAVGNPGATGSVSPPTGASGTTGSTGATGSTDSPSQGYAGLLGANAIVNFQNRTYQNAQGQNVPIPIPGADKLVQGSQNRVWYTDTGGQHLLTQGNGPLINPTTNKPAGGGGESLPSYARGLRTYTVHYGDNLASVATKLRIPGGLSGWMEHNGFPSDFYHGMVLSIPRSR
jgi:hypothetical protein